MKTCDKTPTRTCMFTASPFSWHTFCSSQVRKRYCGALRYTQQGVRPMVSRRHIMRLGLGILSTVIGCAVAPPATPPPEAPPPAAAPTAVAPAATVAPPATPPPSDIPPIVVPSPYIHSPYAAGDRRPDTYQPSPYEKKMDE